MAVGAASTMQDAPTFSVVAVAGYGGGITFGVLKMNKARRLRREREALSGAAYSVPTVSSGWANVSPARVSSNAAESRSYSAAVASVSPVSIRSTPSSHSPERR